MEKKYYRCIILILASTNLPIYAQFKKIWETYMWENQHILVQFVYAENPNIIAKAYDLIYSDLKETVIPPWTTKKVIRAIEDINNKYNYDYLIRTNLSTFWYFDQLLLRLNKLPKVGCLTGRLGYILPPFVVGTGMIISRDISDIVIQNKFKIEQNYTKYVAEDRILSELITNTGIKIIPDNKTVCNIENITEYDPQAINSIIIQAKNSCVDHFRVKNPSCREVLDISILKQLCQTYYNKTPEV